MVDLNGIAAILAAIVPATASVLVVILQIRAGKKQKTRDEVEGMREELRKKEEKERHDMLEKTGEKLDGLTEGLNKLSETVERVTDKQEETDRTVRQLNQQMKSTTRILLNHQRATAEVLNTVAEGFRDNKLSGNVTAAIEKYHNVENNMLQDALRSATDCDDK